jgi:hypothetical protein
MSTHKREEFLSLFASSSSRKDIRFVLFKVVCSLDFFLLRSRLYDKLTTPMIRFPTNFFFSSPTIRVGLIIPVFLSEKKTEN